MSEARTYPISGELVIRPDKNGQATVSKVTVELEGIGSLIEQIVGTDALSLGQTLWRGMNDDDIEVEIKVSRSRK